MIWRTKNHARAQGIVPSSRIHFVSNRSKFIPRKLDLGPLSKVGLNTNNDISQIVIKCTNMQDFSFTQLLMDSPPPSSRNAMVPHVPLVFGLSHAPSVVYDDISHS